MSATANSETAKELKFTLWILSLLCLPIPPQRRIEYYNTFCMNCQAIQHMKISGPEIQARIPLTHPDSHRCAVIIMQNPLFRCAKYKMRCHGIEVRFHAMRTIARPRSLHPPDCLNQNHYSSSSTVQFSSCKDSSFSRISFASASSCDCRSRTSTVLTILISVLEYRGARLLASSRKLRRIRDF